MRMVVTGGGTAGHISPVLATLEELEKLDKNLKTLYIGSAKSIEEKVTAEIPIEFVSIPSGKFRRYNRGLIKASLDMQTNWRNLVDIFKINKGVIRSIRILRKFRPDIIFIKGGYVGLPVGIAAKILRIPFVNHESDIVPGVTNRILSKWSAKTAVGFPVKYYDSLDKNKLVFVGNPIRKSVIQAEKEESMKYYNLNPLIPTVLIFGGSIGSNAINQLTFASLKLILGKYQVIHLTGDKDLDLANKVAKELPMSLRKYYKAFGFLKNKMGYAYSVADIIVSRAGANTIAEIAYWAKPSIIIPLGSSANNHQNINAEILSNAGAARVVKQDKLTSLGFVSTIDNLMSSKNDRDYLSKNISKFYNPDASTKLAQLIYQIGENTK
jgi:UDP-N-acetylglucosamine--N-acetylmuramyl-(pentapeptide) pyrophosphoryl-undecaprenol N-acetylglucosamine transferase